MKRFLIFFSCLFFFSLCAAADHQPLTSSDSEARCNTAIDRCAGPPAPRPCPPGKHWSLAGSKIAHCVLDDPICPAGTTLKHDFLGNPSCEIPIVSCNSNQIWDGTTCQARCPSPMRWDVGASQCACPQGQYWSDMASTCVNAPTCNTDEVWNPTTHRCDYTGPTCPWGGPQNYPTCACPSNFVWNGGSCVPASCPSGQRWDVASQACIAIFVPSCPSGTTWNSSVCQPDAQACPANQSWNGSSCVAVIPNCPAGSTWDGSTCAANAPVCPSGQVWNGSACISSACPPSGPQNFPMCSCAAGSIWDGNICTVPLCPPNSTWNGYICLKEICLDTVLDIANACPLPQTGILTMRNTFDCKGNLKSSVQVSSTCNDPAITCPGPEIRNTTLWPNGLQKSYTMVEYTPSVNGKSCIPEYQNYTCDKSGRCDIN